VDLCRRVISALESGDVIFFPDLRFETTPREQRVFSPSIVGSSKNVSFDPASRKIACEAASEEDRGCLSEMLGRFNSQAAALVNSLLPAYRGRVTQGRASFRPVEIAGRKSSWRKDDTRLHVDAFPSNPVQGRRILRVFTNVNLEGRPRTWRVGERFAELAARFASSLRAPFPGITAALRLFHLTKSRRSAYDAMMLQLHDRMKSDDAYQSASPQTTVDFPAGATWMAFTDQVTHAAMAGQYQLEQTFLLPVAAMEDEQKSPLRTLERVKGRPLV
jgi:hypothetical protein